MAPAADAHSRDERRRRYALAGIPVYVVIDDFDDEGTVTVFSSPDPDKGTYATKTTVSYGTPVTVPEGPAKGLVIGEEVTRP